MKGSSSAHAELIAEIKLKVGALPFVRIWSRVVGTFYRVRRDPQTGRVTEAIAVTVGTPGEPDLDGILLMRNGMGVRLGIEAKTGNAVQNPEQRAYEAMIVRMGGIYIVARSADDALDQITKLRLK